MSTTGWTTASMPPQTGRVVVVTGANSGLGYETALALAGRGAHVVLACRDIERGERAGASIRASHPDALTEVIPLDLASLAGIRAFASKLRARFDRIDLLCNNAGVMALPHRKTADGFEMQLGTNHLGHFALTGLLLDRLLVAPGGRVVTVSSAFHRLGRISWEDLQLERTYNRWRAYAQSKLANLLFAFELDRRLRTKKAPLTSVAAHPGYAATNLQTAGAKLEGSRLLERGAEIANRVFAQDAAAGALPSLYAATALDATGGAYFGPSGFLELVGPPRLVGSSARSRDRAAAARLWGVSEELTGVRYDALE